MSCDRIAIVDLSGHCFVNNGLLCPSHGERNRLLKAIRHVDLVIPDEGGGRKRTVVHEHHVDTLVIGGDWERRAALGAGAGTTTGWA